MKILDVFKKCDTDHNRVVNPYLIAEAGVNHEAKIDLAYRLIDEAKEGGADGIKFQTYKAETIASKNSPAYWDTTKEKTDSQFKLFQKYDKFWKKEFELLKNYCDKVKIEFLSTPFDKESAVFLNDMMDVFKISSSDITNRPFIEFICDFKKPIILSTGASNLDEISEAVSWIDAKSNKFCLLHCVLNYPTDDRNANLGMIRDLQSKFPQRLIGYSDHTLPKDMRSLEVATLLGCRILEKHFTFDKTLPGNDHYHAMDKEDVKIFKHNLARCLELIGDYSKAALQSEEPARNHARRSLVATRTLKAGAKISMEDLTWKRPAHGISPKDIEKVLGKLVKQEITEDTVLQWDMF